MVRQWPRCLEKVGAEGRCGGVAMQSAERSMAARLGLSSSATLWWIRLWRRTCTNPASSRDCGTTAWQTYPESNVRLVFPEKFATCTPVQPTPFSPFSCLGRLVLRLCAASILLPEIRGRSTVDLLQRFNPAQDGQSFCDPGRKEQQFAQRHMS